MKANQKFLPTFLLGAAAGALVATFLHGERGQQVVQNIKTAVKDAAGELKEGIENFDDTLEKWANRGRNLVTELKGNKKEDLYDLEEIFS